MEYEYDLNKLKQITKCDEVTGAFGPLNGATYSNEIKFRSVWLKDGVVIRESQDVISLVDYDALVRL